MSNLDQFMMECNAVRAGTIVAITGLRKRSADEGLSLSRMRLAAEATDVEIVSDGKELKVIKAANFYAYDEDGDVGDDCAELGGLSAPNLDAARVEAQRVWPGTKNIRVAAI